MSTPLHWACYSRSEIALNYLLSMNPLLEAHDQQGFTPLHLAVKSVEQLRSSRPVRALLLKGADRNAKDSNGQTPMDMVDNCNLPDSLKADLKQILDDPAYCECIMLKTPLIPLKPNHNTQLLFIVLFMVIFFCLFAFLFPT
mmetsp:Transcript_43314/g.41721  ORF Transcript_43314/g.41721 Transcript_43314/m.41721 type:complete len:142 (+) Transcript_43314:976-1401(+)